MLRESICREKNDKIMTKTPNAYAAATAYEFDPASVYWLFNEIGNAGNGNYYRLDDKGVYHDRSG